MGIKIHDKGLKNYVFDKFVYSIVFPNNFQNLPITHMIRLEVYLNNMNITCKRIQDELFEADMEGVKILNILGRSDFR